MKIIFFGTPIFAVATLETLIKNHEVLAVVTQPDKPKGRGNKVIFSPVKEKALEHEIKVLQPIRARSPEFINELREYPADIFVVAAYGQILPEDILNMPQNGCINVHGSLLPKYRGAAPIQQAVIDGESITGITIMYMDKGIDTGDMLLKKELPILPEDTAVTLTDKMAELGAGAIIEALDLIETNQAPRERQDEALSSYAKPITKEMGNLDFRKTSRDIVNLVRGLNPWPVAYTFYQGEAMKIWKAEVFESGKSGNTGEIIEVLPNRGIAVKTVDAAVIFTEVQTLGGKRMKASDYLRGHKISVGEIFKNEQGD